MQNPRTSALSIIDHYRKHHRAVYMSNEKNIIYDWTLEEAYYSVLRSHSTPLAVLEGLLSKYDTWAHSKARSADDFKIAVSAIDDLIDQLLTS